MKLIMLEGKRFGKLIVIEAKWKQMTNTENHYGCVSVIVEMKCWF